MQLFSACLSLPQWRVLFSMDMLQLCAKPKPGGKRGLHVDFCAHTTTGWGQPQHPEGKKLNKLPLGISLFLSYPS